MLEYPAHLEMQKFVKTLNHLYLDTPALWEEDHDWHGFQWVQADDSENSVFAFLRYNYAHDEAILCVLNMTPGVIQDYTFVMPISGEFELILNSDDPEFGGSNYLSGFDKGLIYETYEHEILPADYQKEEVPEQSKRNRIS